MTLSWIMTWRWWAGERRRMGWGEEEDGLKYWLVRSALD
jgi:hypothetical protein